MRSPLFDLHNKLNAVEATVTQFEVWTTFVSAGLLTSTAAAYIIMM